MSKDWEATFTHWAKGPAATESQRCENAIKAIKNAIDKSAELKNRNIEVFLQGSYRNRVNVRQDSDVDVGLLCRDTFFYEHSEEISADSLNITAATYDYPEFKNDVQKALVAYFGAGTVTRGNKAFDIKANSYRVEADLAPFFEHRYYWSSTSYREGVKLTPDSGGSIENYPEQHYDNGVSKNDSTNRRYKRVVRILKNLKSDMENNYSSAHEVPGFLLECLAFNVPNDNFSSTAYKSIVRSTLAHIFNNARPSADCSKWVEVNDIKYLFHSTQPWTKAQAHKFISDAWDYIGYE